ncbi:15730_t:CDS:2, partial [Gigaspora margarita]
MKNFCWALYLLYQPTTIEDSVIDYKKAKNNLNLDKYNSNISDEEMTNNKAIKLKTINKMAKKNFSLIKRMIEDLENGCSSNTFYWQ